MAAVLELPPDPDRDAPPGDPRPALTIAATDTSATGTPPQSAGGSGLKPIARLTSDSRIERIIPDSDAVTVLRYSSQFARDFIRSDYNFCASKIAVARGGKMRAIETGLRDASEWLRKATAWVEKHNARSIALPHEVIELKVTRPLAGLLVRCLTQYDRLFVGTLEAVLAEKLKGEERETILLNAAKRIRQIGQICIPDNDAYDFDGTRRDQ
ncbi:DUF1845 domain-containing protein [Paraburkholderia sp. BL10I2N1]|uniref:DUF1845 domain-containing protein n=1 Tax=Paraburkholderia sp. BL10I2N1 TaxID=1938796 RepID=UPI00105CD5B8|nr:DUF1845 domain-containing protein [Paraburkholderia sp. BL10I2N1]TDN59013.1 hypothetical protein B0G77_8198 [Paraburkholderia sp. BL10I2N1]